MKSILPLALACSTLSPLAAAQLPDVMGQEVNPANGKTYLILEESTWTDARAAAVNLGGQLTTIDDQAENDWIFQAFGAWGGQSRDLWIGLEDIMVEGNHVWASGDPVIYTNWAFGQPDNYLGNDPFNGEDHVHMYGDQSPYGPGLWNDMHDADPGTAGWTFGLYGVVEVQWPVYTMTPLVGGTAATLTLTEVTPFGDVLVGFSTRGAGPTNTIYGPLAMTPPITQLPIFTADANGVATLSLRIKPFMSGATVYTQALDLKSGGLSNPRVELVL